MLFFRERRIGAEDTNVRKHIRTPGNMTLTRVTTLAAGKPALLAIALTLLAHTGLATADTQSLDSIRDVASSYAEEHLLPDGQRSDVEIGSLDPRLRLRRCDAPLEAFRNHANRNSGRSTIGVRCTGTTPWTIYVSARINSYTEVYRLARSLHRGKRLQEADLVRVEANVGRLGHGYITDSDRIIGMELRRAARQGEVVTPSLLAAPELIRRGQTVTVLAETATTHVSMRGEALDSGALGDRIRIRNTRSQRVVEGEIIGDSRVRIPL